MFNPEPVEVMRVPNADGYQFADDQELFSRGYSDDAGIDLFSCIEEPLIIRPGGFRDIPLGVAVKLPPGTWGMLTGRSSTLRNHGLMVSHGVIDEGYRGPLFAAVFNLRDEPVTVAPRSRLVQLIVLPSHTAVPRVVTRLDSSERGSAGFGSTGE